MRAFEDYRFERSLLRACTFPTYYAYGDLSHQEALKAGILAQIFPDIHVERFAGIHHFVPPQQIYTPKHVASLLDLWARAERSDAP
jgi:hypothetical protein